MFYNKYKIIIVIKENIDNSQKIKYNSKCRIKDEKLYYLMNFNFVVERRVFMDSQLGILIFCFLIFIICCIVCVCYRERNDKNNKNYNQDSYAEQDYKRYKIRMISIIIGCIFFGISMMFVLNILFSENVFSIKSDLNDKEAFSLIISFLTLVATVLIAIVQFMIQDRIKKEESKKDEHYQDEQKKQKLYKRMEEITCSLNERVKVFNFLYNDLSVFTDGMFCCFDDTSESFVVSFDFGYVLHYHHSLQIKSIKISGMNSYKNGMTIEDDLIRIENEKLNILLKEDSRNPVILAINKFITTSTFYNACFVVKIIIYDNEDDYQASVKLIIELTSLRGLISTDSQVIVDGVCDARVVNKTIEKVERNPLVK